MKILDVMTKKVAFCVEEDTLAYCAKVMNELGIGALPVLDTDDNLTGMITDRDITVRAIANEVDVTHAKVGEYASSPVVTASPETDVEEALNMMSAKQIRRLPVIDNGRLAGIVTIGDLALSLEEEKVGHVLHEVSLP